MTINDRFELHVAAWLHDEARRRVPDHLSEVLAATARTRQRPAWSSLERWLPVDLTFRPVPFAVGRAVRIAVALALVLVAAGAVYLLAGAIAPRVPEPFGLARNGLVSYWRGGDIYVDNADRTGERRIVEGATTDLAPWFSHDGTRLAFLREEGPDAMRVMVVAPDGSGLRAISDALPGADWFEWSPRDDAIAVVHTGADGESRVLSILDPDAATTSTLELPFSVDNSVYWRPPDGRELIVTGREKPDMSFMPRIYAVSLDGTVRPITPLATHRDTYQEVVLSPDGRTAAYGAYEPVPGDPDTPAAARIHVLDLETGADRVIDFGPGSDEMQPAFSPDGAKVAFVTDCVDCPGRVPAQVVVADVDGTGATPIGRAFGFIGAPTLQWSPDGRQLVITQPDATSWVMSTDGPGEMTRWIPNFSGWQRLAP